MGIVIDLAGVLIRNRAFERQYGLPETKVMYLPWSIIEACRLDPDIQPVTYDPAYKQTEMQIVGITIRSIEDVTQTIR